MKYKIFKIHSFSPVRYVVACIEAASKITISFFLSKSSLHHAALLIQADLTTVANSISKNKQTHRTPPPPTNIPPSDPCSDVNWLLATQGIPKAQCTTPTATEKHKALNANRAEFSPSTVPQGIFQLPTRWSLNPQTNTLQMFTYGTQHWWSSLGREWKAHLHRYRWEGV